MCRQTVVGIGEIPYIIDQDVNPDHIRPDHVFFVFGCVDSPPSGHTQNIDDSGNSVKYVVPSSVQPYIFRGQPPGIPSVDGRFKITCNGDQNIDGNDGKGIGFKPVSFSDSPFVFDHHKSDTSGQCGIEFGVMEPAVHI